MKPDVMDHVVVGMRGGVDSSVAAAKLVDDGYHVIGVMLRLWSDEKAGAENRCCTLESTQIAKQIAANLGIPFYVINAQEQFHSTVVRYFADSYYDGFTPNPCVICNRTIRWGYLLDIARSLGANYLATGHYARIRKDSNDGYQLMRGIDGGKDQSYVLSMLNQEQLSQTLLPLGDYHKEQVREMARAYHLPVSERPDSQDLCFLAGGDYREFLQRYFENDTTSGEIVDRSGVVLGKHDGLQGYTIGQRKGLKLSSAEPYYVMAIDRKKNQLVVGHHDELGRTSFTVTGINWISGEVPTSDLQVNVKIRYRSSLHPAIIHPDNNTALVELKQPVRDITPGQFAVFYMDDIVIGAGVIGTGLPEKD
jgi:tRNA-specific 2-thiouridylase